MTNRIIILLLLCTVSSCGFHLRGYQPKTSSSTSMRVQAVAVYLVNAGGGETAVAVKRQLAGAGATSAASIDKADYVLRLEGESIDRTVLSVSAETGKVGQYQLTLSVYMTLLDSSGKELVPAEEIREMRDYTFDESAVLGKFEEESVLRADLAEQAAAQVLRNLSSVIEEK